jgi:excisionase family DNA binding protein
MSAKASTVRYGTLYRECGEAKAAWFTNADREVANSMSRAENEIAATQVLERDWRDRPTVTVEESGEILGIGRNSAYEGVNSGQIPSIRVGRRIVVPTAQLRRLLGEVA